MKKKVMNIRPQEVTENGERSVQYKGSDGKFHNVAPSGGNGSTAQDNVFVIQEGINQPVKKLIGYEEVDSSIDELHEALYNNPFGTKVVAVDHFYYHVMYLTEIDHANHTMDFDNVVFEFQCFDSMVIGNFVLRVQNGEKTLNVHMEN